MGKKRYVDIRSNGRGVIGRVHQFSQIGEEIITPFRGQTRKHMIKKLKKAFPTVTNIHFNRRGITYF